MSDDESVRRTGSMWGREPHEPTLSFQFKSQFCGKCIFLENYFYRSITLLLLLIIDQNLFNHKGHACFHVIIKTRLQV